MWFGCHRPPEETGSPIYPSGHFEIFSASSEDGRRWTCDSRTTPAFSASRDVDLFDGRFVSTPRVVAARGQQMLFYSARDCGTLYGAGDGTVRADSAGIYRHIGVAVRAVPAAAM